jgi:hypothetical protein
MLEYNLPPKKLDDVIQEWKKTNVKEVKIQPFERYGIRPGHGVLTDSLIFVSRAWGIRLAISNPEEAEDKIEQMIKELHEESKGKLQGIGRVYMPQENDYIPDLVNNLKSHLKYVTTNVQKNKQPKELLNRMREDVKHLPQQGNTYIEFDKKIKPIDYVETRLKENEIEIEMLPLLEPVGITYLGRRVVS